jgi:hypothetical protein
MQVVILTSALSATNEPSRPEFICCQIKALGPTFTVPPIRWPRCRRTSPSPPARRRT